MGRAGRVALEIGAEHQHVRIARLVAAGMAALAGFDVESVEDLRIAVDEGCVWLIGRGDGSPLSLSFCGPADGVLEVSGETRVGAGADDAVTDRLVEQIMGAACTEHRFTVGGGTVSFWLVTRCVPADLAALHRPEPFDG